MSAEPVRLNKFLASCGVGSRRQCDALVQAGEITVNGEACLSPGIRVGEDDTVRLNGKVVAPKITTTIVLNKPRGYVCTKNDELGRETVFSLLPPKLQHLNHVGRLDQDSEGLLILTNDGELANRLTHPRSKTEKEYLVTLNNHFENEVLDRLVAGLPTPSGKARAKIVKRLSPRRVAMVLETGLKRQIREMFKTINHRVTKLIRVRIGSFMDPALPVGRHRALEGPEIEALLINPEAPKRDANRPARKTAIKRRTPRPPSKRIKGKRPAKKSAPRKNAAKRAPGRQKKRR